MAVICAKVALVPLAFDLGSDIPFVVAKGALSHALAYVLAGVIGGLLILYRRAVVAVSMLHIAVAAFLIVNIAATVFAADQILALYGAHGRMVGLATIADGVLLYFAIVLLVRTMAEMRYVMVCGLAGSLVVLAYTLLQFLGRDPIAWGLPAGFRPFSTFGQPTSLAEYLTVVCVGTAVLGLLDTSLPRLVRWLLVLLSVAMLAGMISTQTRSGLLGIGLAAVVVVVLIWFRHPSRRVRLWSLGASVAGAAALALIVSFTPLGARLLSTVSLGSTSASPADENSPQLEESADVHLGFYRIAFAMVQERPVLGFGPDNFAVGLPKYRPEGAPPEVQQGLTTSAHSWVAQVGSASGVLGLIAFAAVTLGALVVALKAGFHPVAWTGAAMVAAFVGVGLTTVNAVSTEWLFWAGVGVVGTMTARSLPDPAPNPGRQHSPSAKARFRGPRIVLALSCAVVGVALALTEINALGASRAAHLAQVIRLAGQPRAAIDAGLRATELDPLRAPYWDQLGLAYVSANRLRDGAAAFARASTLAPYDIRYSSDLARAYIGLVQAGDASYAAQARDAANHAVLTDPNNPQALATRALAMAVTGELSEAVPSIEKAVALDPRAVNTDMYVVAEQVYRASGRYDEAIALARRAIAVHSGPAQDTVQIRVELARVLAAAGQPAEAVKELDAVLAIVPNDPVATQLRNQYRSKSTGP